MLLISLSRRLPAFGLPLTWNRPVCMENPDRIVRRVDMRLKTLVISVAFSLLVACNIGQEGETKEECAENFLLMALIVQATASFPQNQSEQDQREINEFALQVLSPALLCKDGNQDIFADIFN